MKRAVNQSRLKFLPSEQSVHTKQDRPPLWSEKTHKTVVCSHAIFYQAVSCNMATRAENQPISSISVFWQDPGTEKQHDWSRWIEMFEAKYSISLEKLTRKDAAKNPRK